MTAEGALDLPALAVIGAFENSLHFSAVRCDGPCSIGAQAALLPDGDQRRANRQLFSAESMIVLGIIALVSQQLINRLIGDRLTYRWLELRRILAGTHANKRR